MNLAKFAKLSREYQEVELTAERAESTRKEARRHLPSTSWVVDPAGPEHVRLYWRHTARDQRTTYLVPLDRLPKWYQEWRAGWIAEREEREEKGLPNFSCFLDESQKFSEWVRQFKE